MKGRLFGDIENLKKNWKKFEKKTKNENFETVSQCRKLFALFETLVCCKTSKNLRGGPFGDKKFRKFFWKKFGKK